ncbi:MAG: CpaF family protein [Alphaproteobacteria bacterium]|jgi:pilus assembly protein CpaF|nr:CpaF family protein [Rickettsiales bacterium]
MSDDLEQRLKTLETQVQLLTRIIGAEGEGEADLPLAHQQTRLLQAVERLAPIKALLEADEVNDILINADRSVYVERLGRLEKTRVQFESDTEVFKLAEEIVARIGRHINPQRPLVDARLPDGSRVNIIAPPLSVDGTMISIRKFSKHSITLDSMAAQGNISSPLGEFLKVAGKCRLNIIVSGGTGSGKTTLLNAISQYIDPDERVVTIEDAAELKLQQPHVVRLESKPTSFGQKREEEVTIRDLVKNALRMRPDRIIVGEVRGPEAFDMMQAMNTGHEGSLTTVHANHPRDAIARLENMMNMANLGLSSAGIRAQIASAIHIIIQISRMRDGHRRVTHISEVVGIEGDIITMQELFTFQTKGEDKDGKLVGEFRWSGIMPRFLRRVAYYGESEHLAKALGIRLPGM